MRDTQSQLPLKKKQVTSYSQYRQMLLIKLPINLC